ncbi:unnamed protein product [Paramecium pentaurelia]|uniref:RING-type domain-containing protein n=1 Tax=Paramecium pentaurelia TaxID=43138 RepID=A0A8S1S207_9CILI|nr:unnamed protein product [Paramecium pentaurelia]
MNQQQIILQNLRELKRNIKIDLLIKYIEIIVYSITICFIQKDTTLYKFYQSSLIVFIQGIALTHYYSYIIYNHKKQVQNFGYDWDAPFNNLQSYDPEHLNNSIIIYHTNFLIVKISNLVFEIVLFISTPYEVYRYLQASLNSYSNIIIFEIVLYFARRVQLLLLPFLGVFKCCLLFLFTILRRNNQIILQHQPIQNVSIQLQEKTCQETELDCIICLEKITDKYIVLSCDHFYHKECIDNWITQKRICPMCRSPIN